jgi:very-short-patch-repair endonuclease
MVPISPFTERVRNLRRNQTHAERKLWSKLRARQLCGVKFRRQHPIGPYIVDFCSPERAMVIEVDGGQHSENVETDRKRSDYLTSHGYCVLRFWNHEVMENIEAVLKKIKIALNGEADDSIKFLSPSGGEDKALS